MRNYFKCKLLSTFEKFSFWYGDCLLISFLVGFVVEIDLDGSLPEVVRLLVEHKLLSAPVVDIGAPKDATWVERYIGVVEFAGIVFWILHQVSNLVFRMTSFKGILIPNLCLNLVISKLDYWILPFLWMTLLLLTWNLDCLKELDIGMQLSQWPYQ